MYDINESLGVVLTQATDRVASIRTREDRLNQVTDLIESKRALTQTFAGWDVRIGRE